MDYIVEGNIGVSMFVTYMLDISSYEYNGSTLNKFFIMSEQAHAKLFRHQ